MHSVINLAAYRNDVVMVANSKYDLIRAGSKLLYLKGRTICMRDAMISKNMIVFNSRF